MKLNYVIIICVLAFCKTLQAQTVSGKIISTANEDIPFATIQIGSDFGVISNEEGNFTIETKGFQETDSVTISCLGFDKNTFLLKNFTSKNYILAEKVNELSEVLLKHDALSLDSILFYTNKNLKTNYKLNLNEFAVFNRKTNYIISDNADFEIKKSTGFKKKQLEAFNKDFDKLEYDLVNNKSKHYADFVGEIKILNNEKAKLNIEKAVSLEDKNNNQASVENLMERAQEIILKHLDEKKKYKVKSGLLKMSDSASLDKEEIKKSQDTISNLQYYRNEVFKTLKNNSFTNNKINLDFITETDKYDYTLKDVTFLENEMVYIIQFSPKRSSALYTGTMYISDETFAVIRADYKFYKGRIGEKVNLKLLLGIKFVEKNLKGIVVYKKDADNFYYPSYINHQLDRYFYIDRPVKFIENDNTKNKVAFNFTIEGTFKEKTELLILSRKDITTELYNSFNEKKRVEFEKIETYNPSIWKDYTVLEPLNEMKNFKTEPKE